MMGAQLVKLDNIFYRTCVNDTRRFPENVCSRAVHYGLINTPVKAGGKRGCNMTNNESQIII